MDNQSGRSKRDTFSPCTMHSAAPPRRVWTGSPIAHGVRVYYCSTYCKAVRVGGGIVEDTCYEKRRAEACLDRRTSLPSRTSERGSFGNLEIKSPFERRPVPPPNVFWFTPPPTHTQASSFPIVEFICNDSPRLCARGRSRLAMDGRRRAPRLTAPCQV